jgi:hypothetical protein
LLHCKYITYMTKGDCGLGLSPATNQGVSFQD